MITTVDLENTGHSLIFSKHEESSSINSSNRNRIFKKSSDDQELSIISRDQEENAIVNTEEIDVRETKPTKILQRMLSHISTLSYKLSSLPTMPMNNSRFLNNRFENSLSKREIAEIQLYGLLNDPEESLPTFARKENQMSLDEISKELNTPPFITERLLNVINSLCHNDPSELLNQKTVIKLTRILNGTMDVRVLLLFMMLDANNDNLMTKDEMNNFMEMYLKSISFKHDQLRVAMEFLLKRFHLDTKNQIDFEEFYSIVTNDPIIIETFSRFTVNPTCFIIPLSNSDSSGAQRCCDCSCLNFCNRQKAKLTPEYFRINLSRYLFLVIYIFINLGLTLFVAIYRSKVLHNNVYVIFARIGGMLLNFNCSFIIVLMFKQTILLIRSNRFLRRIIPVDDHIEFHRFVGIFIVILTFVHVIAHMINFSKDQKYSWTTLMFTTIPNIGWIGGFACLSGIILCVILLIMFIFSMDWIRRKGYFEIFYWTHRSYILFFIFLIIHAKDFWKWIIGPLCWFILEKMYSKYVTFSSRNGRTSLISVTIQQSNVISLCIKRPKNFIFKPGDYILLNIPEITFYEFHPFTISSAPEDFDAISVHIQAVGHWTKGVYSYFKNMSETNETNSFSVKIIRADQNSNENERTTTDERSFPIFLNGPYSSCARYIFDCEHAILVAGGIGVTPYASILSSLMAQFRQARRVCQHCHQINYDQKDFIENHRIRKVDFIWACRDYKSFEWFFNVLYQLEEEEESYLQLNPNGTRFLTIHLYFTEIKSDEHIGYFPLQLITRVWADATGKDILSGLKSRTYIGRPSWKKIFSEISSTGNLTQNRNTSVFFCGPPAMGQSVKEHSLENNFRFFEENF